MKALPKIAAPLGAIGLVLTLAAAGLGDSTADPRAVAATEANITRLTAGVLERSQFAHHPLDNELAGKFLDRYLDALDGSRSLLTQVDLDEFARYRASLPELTRGPGDTGPAHAIFARYLQRLEQRVDHVTKLLRSEKLTFTGQDTFAFDRSKAERPRDPEAAKALWRQQVRFEYLQEKLADKKPAQIVTTLTRRYGQQLRTMKQLKRDDVVELYLNALAQVYDPHSDYLGHQQMETFSMSMNLKLFGIGAVLRNEDGYTKIQELVAGGPAARSGLLKPGDRIVAVAQGTKEPVDIVNVPITHAVEKIRGPKGSTVTLTILPAGAADGAPPKKVVLVRDEIKLEEQESKARILDWPTDKGQTLRLAVIDLPSFYADMGGRDAALDGRGGGRSATADVLRLLAKLKTERVEGIALDLRRNGGGSLEEAIKLTGLFIRTGPVVQTRGPDGDIEVGNDPDSSLHYDGPLVVLTSRISASASEILAGAVQDYGRAVLVGDTATFGKGTVQTLMPLAPLMDRSGLAYSYDPGALKITIRKFYRPGGASMQLRGVPSDIVLPSPTDLSEVSEASLPNPLAWDSVPPARYQPVNLVQPYLGALKEGSARRVAAAKEFAFLREELALFKKAEAEKSVSLNEAERRKEMAETKAQLERRKQQAKLLTPIRATTYEIRLKNTSSPGLPPPLAVASGNTAQASSAKKAEPTEEAASEGLRLDEITLNESLRILADYVRLTKEKAGNQPR
jgi:carboxyl-terminal processing protease